MPDAHPQTSARTAITLHDYEVPRPGRPAQAGPVRRRFAGRPLLGAADGRRRLPIAEGPRRSSVRVRGRRYRRSLCTADALAAGLALLLAGVVFGDDALQPTAVAVPLLVVVIFAVAGLYEREEIVLHRSTLDEAPVLFQLTGLFALLTWALGDSIVAGALEQRQVLGLWALSFLLALGGRFVARRLARRASPEERCLVIADVQTADHVRRKLASSRTKARAVATLPISEGHALALAGSVVPFRRLVTELEVDRVILAPVSTDSADVLELIRVAKAAGISVSVLPRMLEVVGTSVEFDDVDGLAMLGLRKFGLGRTSTWLKRAFDFTGAAVGVLMVSPVLLVIALAIRLDSKGPVLFRQTRVGRDDRPFGMLKFRSMVPDAEARKADLAHRNEAVGLFKIADDPRITRVGRILRRTSLDELPQLFNVLRGEMSLVGPRPLVLDEDAQVEGMLRSRLHLTPGMTGPWQVLGSSRIPMPEMIKLDYLYVANWSLWTDVKLLLRTVPYMLMRGGM